MLEARRGSICRFVAHLLLCSAVLLPAAAVGEDQPADRAEPSAADKATARHLMDVGDEKKAQQDYVGALEAYQGADRIMGVPTTAIDVGRTLLLLGRLVEAQDAFWRAARHPVAPNEPEPYTQAREEARRLAAETAEKIPSLELQIAGVAADTPVRIRIGPTQVAPETVHLPQKLDPGEHQVVAQADGYLDVRKAVTLHEGQMASLRIEFTPDPNAKPGSGSASGADAATDSGISPLVWVGFGVGAAGFIVGGITGGIALSDASSYDDECPNKVCPPDRESDLDSSLTLAHVSTVSLIVGGAGTALGLIALFALSDDGAAASPEAAVAPIVGPGFAGLRGSF